MAADRAPEVGALVGVNVLRGADVGAAERVVGGELKQRRVGGVGGDAVAVREDVGGVVGVLSAAARHDELDRNDVDGDGGGGVGGGRGTHHVVGVLRTTVGVGAIPCLQGRARDGRHDGIGVQPRGEGDELTFGGLVAQLQLPSVLGDCAAESDQGEGGACAELTEVCEGCLHRDRYLLNRAYTGCEPMALDH